MAGNTIGQLFRVTTFGESHGLALGCIVDGVPPCIPLTEADLQHDLDRRRPGHRAIPPSAASRIRSKYSPVFLKALLLAPALAC